MAHTTKRAGLLVAGGLVAGLLGGALGGAAMGQSCPVLPLETSEVRGTVYRTAVVQEPGGQRLYVSGTLERGGQSGSLMRRSGESWEFVEGAPPVLGPLYATEEQDSGILYGVGADSIIWRYDGATWSSFAGPPEPIWVESTGVTALVRFDMDGAGPLAPALYALRSNFRLDGRFIEYWGELYRHNSGGGWTLVSGEVPGGRMAIYDPDGAGPGVPELYISGRRGYTLEDVPWSVVRWSGGVWTAIAHGSTANGEPYALHVFDPDGPGPQAARLVLGGSFTTLWEPGVGTLAAGRIAFWDGQAWSAWPGGFNSGYVGSLAEVDVDGAGPLPARLIAAGGFSRAGGDPADGLAQWTGDQWLEFGGGATGVGGLQGFDPGSAGGRPAALFATGTGSISGQTAGPLNVWNGGAWSGLVKGPGGVVRTLSLFNEGGGGRRLFAAGQFRYAGDAQVNNIARWDGQTWSALGTGIEPVEANPHPLVLATTVHNDGSGWALYAAGSFRSAGGVTVSNIARWNGSAWSDVGGGLSGGPVHALEVHDPDGAGPLPKRLYAGGSFTFAGGAPARKLAYWDGASWHAVPGVPEASGAIRAVRTWDEAGSPVLYVGGDPMNIGGLGVNTAFKLTQAGWAALPPLIGVGARVNAFAFHSVGGEFRVIAAGYFGYEIVAKQLMPGEWTTLASGWSPLGGLRFAARSVDDGHGPALYIGSFRASATGTAMISPRPTGQIYAISPVFDDGNGPGIFIAGDFTRLDNGSPTPRIAVVRVCQTCYPNCDGSAAAPVLNAADFSCFLQRFAAGDMWANCDGSTAAPALNISDFVCFLERFLAGCQ